MITTSVKQIYIFVFEKPNSYLGRNLKNIVMYDSKERKEQSDYLRELGFEKQSDIDAVLDYIYSLAAISIEAVSNKKKQNKHPE